jgi:hypothetical protein
MPTGGVPAQEGRGEMIAARVAILISEAPGSSRPGLATTTTAERILDESYRPEHTAAI